MKPVYLAPLCSLLLAATFNANAAGSMLRVTCADDVAGAEVRVDGKFKGECPLDIELPEGAHKLLVVKPSDESHEKFFEQNIRMGGGVLKRVEVPELEERLTAKGAKLEELKFQNTRKHAEKGDADAMEKLGDLYGDGSGVEKDYEQAFKWHLRAAEAGNSRAMCSISEAYTEGQGVDKNEEQAVLWRQKARDTKRREAEAGDSSAMFSLGWDYLGVCGGEKNIELSKLWLQKRAEALRRDADGGDYAAMKELGAGIGVPNSDDDQENAWMDKFEATALKAAKAGDAKAMLALAYHYRYWKSGGLKDGKYLFWIRKAAEKGNVEAKDEMEILDKLKKLGFH